jgi:hypothetical protein
MNIERYVLDNNRSKPIRIVKTKSDIVSECNIETYYYKQHDYDTFDLKKNFFDPNKNSPPNNWTIRLIGRLKNY